MRAFVTVAFLMWSAVTRAADCVCDPHDPGSMRERQCSLCEVVEKAPLSQVVVFIHDLSPRKPDRLLALPRTHSDGMHQMSAVPADMRVELWRQAIEKAKELWGDKWGIAYNAERFHTQCHVHVHIGKLLDGVEWGEFKVVDGPEQIPLPGVDGLWIHPVNGKLHVHTGEQITETVLLQ